MSPQTVSPRMTSSVFLRASVELRTLRSENARLAAELEGLKVTLAATRAVAKVYPAKPGRRAAKPRLPKGFLSIRFAEGCSLPGTGTLKDKQPAAYLQATKKTEVPAHDPAFGRMA